MNPHRKQYKNGKMGYPASFGLKMAIYKFILIFVLFVTLIDGSSKFYDILLIINYSLTTLLFRMSKIKQKNSSTAVTPECFFINVVRIREIYI